MAFAIRSINYRIIPIFLVFIQTSCKKFVQIDPPSSQITGVTVYSNNGSAAAVMTGLYTRMSNPPSFFTAPLGINYFMAMAGDEIKNYDPTNALAVQFYTNSLSSGTQAASNSYFWPELYNNIYVTNAALEGIENSPAISAPTRQQITGEAKFMRAFLLFYATNLYGNIPLVTTTSYLVNDSISRSPQAEVYNQIVSDLKDAQSKLNPDFVDALGNPSPERTRPNQGAATALLARVYLYMHQWDSAETQATNIINNSIYNLDDSLNDVFLANSTETIWQLQPTAVGYNTKDATYYVLRGTPGPGRGAAMSTYLINAFEPGDARYSHWVGSYTSNHITYYYYPNKYKIWQLNQQVKEYQMVFRLAEQYLIRAEARTQKGDVPGAQSDLNKIRIRAGLDSTTANDQSSLLTAIMHERQVELFTEWGQRWFDLNRTDSLNALMGNPGNVYQVKGGNGTWSPDWSLLPIPYGETVINHNLGQNPGY